MDPRLETIQEYEKRALIDRGWIFLRPFFSTPLARRGWPDSPFQYAKWFFNPFSTFNRFMYMAAAAIGTVYFFFPWWLISLCIGGLFVYHSFFMGRHSGVRVFWRVRRWLLPLWPSAELTKRAEMEVIIVGAGHGGIASAVFLRERGYRVTILEQDSDFGGTWLQNAYPGCRCDIPSPMYSPSFFSPPPFNFKWEPQATLVDHIRDNAKHYGLYECTRFGTQVTGAKYDGATGKWQLDLLSNEGGRQASSVKTCHILISAVGLLSVPSVPKVLRDHVPAAKLFHSAKWRFGQEPGAPSDPAGLNAIRGKRVAVVGAGASAIQLVPEIAPHCKQLFVFQRTPSYIGKKFDFVWPRLLQLAFKLFPFLYSLYRWYLYWAFEFLWLALRDRRSGLSAQVTAAMQQETHKLIDEARTLYPDRPDALPPSRELVPSFAGGCKRTLVSDTWFAALGLPNVQLVARPVAGASADGQSLVDADGKRYPVDVVVAATGFRTTDFLCSLPVVGRGGKSLQDDLWSLDGEMGSPQAYMGVCVPAMPNMFIMYGPSTNLGHNSILLHLEAQAGLVVQACDALIRRQLVDPKIRSVEVRQDAFREWQQTVDARMEKTVFAADCASWYRTADGRLPVNSVYSTVTYISKLSSFNENHFDFQ